MLQNATPLRKSTTWPPNISDENGSCTAATRHPSLQILFKCPTPCHRFLENYKTLTFCLLLAGSQNLQNLLHLPHKTMFQHVSTSKSSANMWGFLHLDIEICFAPQRNKLFEHLNFQNCSEAAVLVHFDFQMCFAPQRRTLFRRLQLPKVVREWCALEILTSKCASRHNVVHFFDISTSESRLSMVCFIYFDFEMCFAPQRRAVFPHHNCRTWGDFSFFTSKCASRHNGVQYFISHLARWFRTRRFSEPTFRPSGATKHYGKLHSEFPVFYLFVHLHLLPLTFSLL